MTKRPRKWEAAFLSSLEATGNISEAAKAAGIGRQTVYDYKEADDEFARRLEVALAGAADNLEAEAIRRSVEGDEEPVYLQGKVVGHRTKKSDTLLMFMIRTLRERSERMERDRGIRVSQAQSNENWGRFLFGDLSLEDVMARQGTGRANGTAAQRRRTTRGRRPDGIQSSNGKTQGLGPVA